MCVQVSMMCVHHFYYIPMYLADRPKSILTKRKYLFLIVIVIEAKVNVVGACLSIPSCPDDEIITQKPY